MNDSITNEIGVSIGMNYTISYVKSNLSFNRNLKNKPGYGIFLEGFFNKKYSEKWDLKTNIIFEHRNIIDRNGLVFKDNAGNILGSVSNLMQTNYCLSVNPLFFHNINNFFSIGVGPSINYLITSKYKLPAPFGDVKNYYYKQFQPEINVCFKVSIEHIVFSFKYSTSLMDKVISNDHLLKEYDHVFRLGIGYLFDINKK